MSREPIFSRLQSHPKGWGDELWITNNEKYCGKMLRFKEGSSFSMHYHIKKEETWCVVHGVLKLEYFEGSTDFRFINSKFKLLIIIKKLKKKHYK